MRRFEHNDSRYITFNYEKKDIEWNNYDFWSYFSYNNPNRIGFNLNIHDKNRTFFLILFERLYREKKIWR